MLERYSTVAMREIWSAENYWRIVLDIELFACEAMQRAGLVPEPAWREIKARAGFDPARIAEIELTTRHDLLAFLQAVGEKVGDSARYLHLGLTSSDVKDTALAVQMKQAGEQLDESLWALRRVLHRQAANHRHTVVVGRTHGVHAEPMTLGMKFALWLDEVERAIARMRRATQTIARGKLSGAVGTYATVDPAVEEEVCQRLGLKPERIATQVIQRDRHAEYLTTLAIIASSLDKMATEIRNLQRTEIREVEEPFAPGQKGSSAMPHKRNPIACEQLTGLARVVRSNAVAALENNVLWHERDMSHSSVERIIIPDSTTLVDYMLQRLTQIIEGLLIYPDNMAANLQRTGGLIYSQRVLLALVGKGMSREQAYGLIQEKAMASWLDNADFRRSLAEDPRVAVLLSEAELAACFANQPFLQRVDTVMARFGL
ncbi:MAG: adenylosuccinate lyase [Negativicutes bacterium]|nr:adenylosuccinate lyase [Negativicutes bacterium]